MRARSLLLVLAACAADPAPETVELDVGAPGKADAAAELRVRVGGTSIWVDRQLAPRARDAARFEWVLAGRASRAITEGTSFVFDDIVGELALNGARSVAVAYPDNHGALLEGVDHFVRLGFPAGDHAPLVTTRLVYRPLLTDFEGRGIWLDVWTRPIVYGGRTVWRIEGHTTGAIDALRAAVGSLALTDLRTTDATHFQIDLMLEQVEALIDGERLAIEADTAIGPRAKSATLALAVRRFGATTGDAYEVWPPPDCTDEVRACLAALPAGAIDLSPCGEAIEVRACPLGGVTFDDVAFVAALERADATLAAGLLRDAEALVGADRVDGFAFAAREAIQARLEGMFGQVFPDAAARDDAADAQATAAIDRAYACPLELVDEPHAPAPGDLAATRQVAADGLLRYMAGIDFEHTEFGRSLEELCRRFRDRHVAALRYFRETSEYVESPSRWTFIGHWLDPLVEISVDRATGAVVRVLFEID
jgi:hypothetical protein